MTVHTQTAAVSAAPASQQIISVTPVTDLVALGVQPGWFVRIGDCSIWFEVETVLSSNMLTIAARDPLVNKTLVLVGNFFSAIDAVCPVAPPYSRWIKLNREKSFFDKFHPELDKIVQSA